MRSNVNAKRQREDQPRKEGETIQARNKRPKGTDLQGSYECQILHALVVPVPTLPALIVATGEDVTVRAQHRSVLIAGYYLHDFQAF